MIFFQKKLFLPSFIVFATFCVVPTSYAERIVGQVTFVGTMERHLHRGIPKYYHSRVEARVENATCDGIKSKELWINLNSGPMYDGNKYDYVKSTFENAYNTLMAAFLSGRNIVLSDNRGNCDDSRLEINVSVGRVGISSYK